MAGRWATCEHVVLLIAPVAVDTCFLAADVWMGAVPCPEPAAIHMLVNVEDPFWLVWGV